MNSIEDKSIEECLDELYEVYLDLLWLEETSNETTHSSSASSTR